MATDTSENTFTQSYEKGSLATLKALIAQNKNNLAPTCKNAGVSIDYQYLTIKTHQAANLIKTYKNDFIYANLNPAQLTRSATKLTDLLDKILTVSRAILANFNTFSAPVGFPDYLSSLGFFAANITAGSVTLDNINSNEELIVTWDAVWTGLWSPKNVDTLRDDIKLVSEALTLFLNVGGNGGISPMAKLGSQNSLLQALNKTETDAAAILEQINHFAAFGWLNSVTPSQWELGALASPPAVHFDSTELHNLQSNYTSFEARVDRWSHTLDISGQLLDCNSDTLSEISSSYVQIF